MDRLPPMTSKQYQLYVLHNTLSNLLLPNEHGDNWHGDPICISCKAGLVDSLPFKWEPHSARCEWARAVDGLNSLIAIIARQEETLVPHQELGRAGGYIGDPTMRSHAAFPSAEETRRLIHEQQLSQLASQILFHAYPFDGKSAVETGTEAGARKAVRIAAALYDEVAKVLDEKEATK